MTSRESSAFPTPSTGAKQTIQARHGTATFVPKSHTIRIINTYGKQVVDTWAFALHAPPAEDELEGEEEEAEKEAEQLSKQEDRKEGGTTASGAASTSWQDIGGSDSTTGITSATTSGAGSGEEIENKEDQVAESKEEKTDKTNEDVKSPPEEEHVENKESKTEGEQPTNSDDKPATDDEPKELEGLDKDSTETAPEGKKTWASYIPSVRGRKTADSSRPSSPEASKASIAPSTENEDKAKGWSAYIPSVRNLRPGGPKDQKPTEQRSWAQYISAGQGFNSYLPSKDSISSFAAAHQRDPSKSIAEQLYEFSKTPVGAAGLSVATGSGYASSVYAAYSAYNQQQGGRIGDHPGMEFLSMPHTRASTHHLSPKPGDTLVSNLRAPLLTLLEDKSPGIHDTLIAACDPQRYKELGVEKWESHGSCAENLVLALQEVNKRVGLKGRNAIGADITVNNVPAPLNLFMNIPVTNDGNVTFEAPAGKRGDYVTFRAERDLLIVMSACPQDVLSINGGKPMVAHFVVEAGSEEDRIEADKKDAEAKKVIEKARLRTEHEKAAKGTTRKPPTKRAPSSASSGKPGLSRARSSQASMQSGISKASRPAPRKLGSSSASVRRQSSQPVVPRQQSIPGQPKRQDSQQQQQFAVPTKETQRVHSPPSKPKATSRPTVQSQGSQQRPSGTPPTNVGRSGKKPKKLERRSAA